MSENHCIGDHGPGSEITTQRRTVKCLPNWTLKHGPDSNLFHCHSADISDAVKQCKDAFPGELIVAAFLDSVAPVPVFILSPDNYSNSGESNPGEFSVNVNDMRGIADKVYVDAALSDGRTDDVITLLVEINRIAGSEGRGKLHLQFIEDQIAMSINKRGDEYIFGLEAAITISETALSDEVRGLNMH